MICFVLTGRTLLAELALRTARQTIGDARLRLRSFAPDRIGNTRRVQDFKGLAARQLLNQLAYVAICRLRFADLVVMAGRLHPFPFRTRP